MEHNIRIKNVTIFASLLNHVWHNILIDIIVFVAVRFGVMITEGWREKLHRNDLHGIDDPIRALDTRYWLYKPGIAEEIVDLVNSIWTYDPQRPHKKCAVLHAICPKCKTNNKAPVVTNCRSCNADISGNWHMHYQTHPRTIKAEVEK